MTISRGLARRLSLAFSVLLAGAVILSGSAAQAVGGSISGHLTDNGVGVAGASVRVYTTTFGFAGSASTDETGAYTIAIADPGEYKIQFIVSGLDQWAHQKRSFGEADVITVGSGAVVVDESLVPAGSVGGHVTRADGTPAAAAIVQLAPEAGGISAETRTDSNGDYVFARVQVGNYTASFQQTFGVPKTFYHHKTSFGDADTVAVTAGARTTIDEQLFGAGAIVGHVTDGGQPVPGVSVSAFGPNQFYSASTGPDGGFRLEALEGTYQVSFRLPNGLEQFAHGKIRSDQADPVVVTAGAETVLEEQIAPTGKIAGHLLNNDGSPAANAFVSLGAGAAISLPSAGTDANGFYEVVAFPGTYVVSFADGVQRMWATATSDPRQARRITVTAGEMTTVDERLLPTGALTVKARDAKTGLPVASFCVFVDVGLSSCTENGTIDFAAAGPGARGLSVSSFPGYSSANVVATVVSGQSKTVTVELLPVATVKAVVLDAATGLPVANACLDLITPGRGIPGNSEVGCSGSDGKLTGTVNAGTYSAFTWANDGVHGHQFVGPNGGVGAASKARLITLKMGETASLTPIKMDRAGNISGVVTDAASGQPLSATVGVSSFSNGGGPTRAHTVADASGRWTLSGLGPYEWPIFTAAFPYASVWSGNTPNRLLATPVKVKPNQTTTYNVALRKGTTLAGVVTGLDGAPLFGARVTVYNAITGDELGAGDTGGDGRYTVQVFGPQIVKLRYEGNAFDVQYNGYYQNSADLDHATPVVIPASGTKTVNVAATRSA